MIGCKPCVESYGKCTIIGGFCLVVTTNSLATDSRMMGLRTVLTRALFGTDPTVIVECRHCGLTVSSETDSCPACGSIDFCCYEIPE